MPLNKEALVLSVSPRSVQDARRWVVDVCQELGREDLSECAELGVSELVTNALLHAEPPISVRVRGTRDHPRVEVADGSPVPPSPNGKMTEEQELLSTIGRGLGLVAMCSDAWGAQIQGDGKVVWFVPGTEPHPDVDLEAGVFEFDESEPSDNAAPPNPLTVRILSLPVPLFEQFRHRYRELRRELRLLALAHEASYPIAKSLSDLFTSFEHEFRFGRALSQLDAAVAEGRQTVDLEFEIDPRLTARIAQMIDLLDLADTFCRTQRLLSLATTPQQQAFERWYLGEFVRQGRGQPPMPWSQATLPDQNAS